MGLEDTQPLALGRIGKRFADLRVRPKLAVLHNTFFLLLAAAVYIASLHPSRWPLALTLGVGYAIAVLLLELILLPLFIYRPLRLILEADLATQRDDYDAELIDPRLIPGDELGQIMRSRNATIALLRLHEADLERKNRQLETAKHSLAEQDRLASLGLLSAGVAHELNTPLAVLHGSIEKLIETVPDPAAQQRLGRMLKVSDRLRGISANLLDFARPARHTMVPVCLRDVVSQAWNLVAIDDKADTTKFTNSVSPQETVTGDPDRLVQVFVNLLRNSLEAVSASGVITVRSERLTRDGVPWIVVAVEDNGPGIPADVLPRIFEAFVSTRLDSRGTGLGLAVAQGIVEQYGGEIEASNHPAGGARLEVRFPAAEAGS